MVILDSQEIKLKVNRLSIQILEHNSDVDQIYLLGINNRGYKLAQYIQNILNKRQANFAEIGRVLINPTDPLAEDVVVDLEVNSLRGRNVILIDDVANTGRTLFYAMKPLMQVLPNRLEVGVLVDRKHKAFPIQVNYVGLSLSTTVQQHIEVNIESRDVYVELF